MERDRRERRNETEAEMKRMMMEIGQG